MENINNRQWEIYNLDNMINSTEYEHNLINKNIENYFDELINKPIENKPIIIIPKSNFSFEKFYKDYIEHNMLFIVLLIGIIFFLIIRYYSKDYDSFDNSNDLEIKKQNNIRYNKDNNTDNSDNKLDELIIKKNKKIKHELNLEKKKLFLYKKQLDDEKQKILSIIDELSSINDYSSIKNQNLNSVNQVYLKNDINDYYSNNYYDSQSRLNSQSYSNINYDKSIASNSDDFSQYDNINKTLNNKSNEVEGLYIEPPFL